MSDPKSILPPNASPLAEALDLLEARLHSLPVSMITKDPATVPVSLLDHLAWEQSVDVWDLEWPEEIKRTVVAMSAELHRYKGTPHAIHLALLPFEVAVEMIEWWQPEGVAQGLERGSFQVTAYAGRSIYPGIRTSVSNEMLEAMTAVVKRAAPVSRKMIFRLGERFRSKVELHGGVRVIQRHDAEIIPRPRPTELQVVQKIRTGQRIRRVSELTHQVEPRPMVSRLGLTLKTMARIQRISAETHHVQRRQRG